MQTVSRLASGSKPVPNTSGLYTAIYKDIINGKVPLPSLPHLALRLRSMARDENTGFQAIAKIVETDPGAASYVLKLANSPAFGTRQKAENLAAAINRMGTSTLVNVVTSYSLRNLFRSKSPVLREALRQVWIKSARLGSTCAVLAREITRHNPDRALLAGLLAHIGALPLIRAAADRFEQAATAEVMQDITQAYGHQVGITLLREWQFDDWMIDVVRNQGVWHYTQPDKPDFAELVLVAELLMRDPAQSSQPTLSSVPAIQRFSQQWPDVEWSPALLTELAEQVDKTEQTLNA